MRSRRVVAAAVLLAVATSGVGLAAPKPPREGPARMASGVHVSVKGRFEPDGDFVARSVEITDGDEMSARGPLDEIDVAGSRVRLGPLWFEIEKDSEIEDETGREIGIAELGTGRVVKVSLEIDGGQLEVDKVKVRVESSDWSRLEGTVQELLPSGAGGFRFTILDRLVIATMDTEWDGLVPPPRISAYDDESERPADAISLGRAGWLSGEARLDWVEERNYDVGDERKDDLTTARMRAELEWILPSTKHVSGMAELKVIGTRYPTDEATDEADIRMGKEETRLGETWLLLSGVLSPWGSIQIGRSRWEDEREWWFREDLDSVRFFFTQRRWAVEASIAQQLVEPAYLLKNARYLLVKATVMPVQSHEISVSFVRREDWYETPEWERDFQPRWIGLHASGEGRKLWRYWLDAAIVRGQDEGMPLDGWGFDAGTVLSFEPKWKPTLALGYAFGSGDEDGTDEVSGTFRQTGLHGNNAKWNGVTDFKYYGEAFQPELANLHVTTIGFGVVPLRELSIDVAWHSYRLDEIALRLVDADIGSDRNLNLVSKDIGEEIDVVFGYEALENWEFELDLGWFRPGKAFPGPPDDARVLGLKVKYVF